MSERSFVFPYIPAGSNQLFRMNRFAVGSLRARIHRDMSALVRREQLLDRARITLEFRWRTRQKRDPLNYVEATKAVVDALVGVWIVDDSADHLEAVVRGRLGTGEADHIVITVEEIA